MASTTSNQLETVAPLRFVAKLFPLTYSTHLCGFTRKCWARMPAMSEGPKSIKLQTAIRTKVSGDTGENRIVAVSYGDLSYSDLESVYQRLSVGNLPRPSESGSEAPPWLTIGCIDFNRVLYIAVVKQD